MERKVLGKVAGEGTRLLAALFPILCHHLIFVNILTAHQEGTIIPEMVFVIRLLL